MAWGPYSDCEAEDGLGFLVLTRLRAHPGLHPDDSGQGRPVPTRLPTSLTGWPGSAHHRWSGRLRGTGCGSASSAGASRGPSWWACSRSPRWHPAGCVCRRRGERGGGLSEVDGTGEAGDGGVGEADQFVGHPLLDREIGRILVVAGEIATRAPHIGVVPVHRRGEHDHTSTFGSAARVHSGVVRQRDTRLTPVAG